MCWPRERVRGTRDRPACHGSRAGWGGHTRCGSRPGGHPGPGTETPSSGNVTPGAATRRIVRAGPGDNVHRVHGGESGAGGSQRARPVSARLRMSLPRGRAPDTNRQLRPASQQTQLRVLDARKAPALPRKQEAQHPAGLTLPPTQPPAHPGFRINYQMSFQPFVRK